jgi:hypothetical protein
MAFIATIEVFSDTSRFKITNDPLGTGTRIALEVSFPSNDGNGDCSTCSSFCNYHIQSSTWYFLCMLSGFGHLYRSVLSLRPFTTPKVSSIAFSIG